MNDAEAQYLRMQQRLDAMAEELQQMIADAESWMQNGQDSRPLDIEPWRLDLKTTQQASALWRAGRCHEARKLLAVMKERNT
jgi:hypothetical protein